MKTLRQVLADVGFEAGVCVDKNDFVDALLALPPTKLAGIMEGATADARATGGGRLKRESVSRPAAATVVEEAVAPPAASQERLPPPPPEDHRRRRSGYRRWGCLLCLRGATAAGAPGESAARAEMRAGHAPGGSHGGN